MEDNPLDQDNEQKEYTDSLNSGLNKLNKCGILKIGKDGWKFDPIQNNKKKVDSRSEQKDQKNINKKRVRKVLTTHNNDLGPQLSAQDEVYNN